MDKDKRKFLKRKVIWGFLRMFIFINGILPLSWSYYLGSILGRIAYGAARRHRKTALENLAIAFSRISLKAQKKIALDSFCAMAQGALELFHFVGNPKDLEGISIEGKQHLDAAIEAGRGVILVSAHLGNFPIMSFKLVNAGYSIYTVVRPMRDKQVDDYVQRVRTEAGIKTIFSYPRRECVQGIITALRNNGVITIQMDQNFGTGGVWVKFFGKLAATPVGPVTLALRTKAALVPAYIYRKEKGRHRIRILPQEEIILTDNKDKTILLNAIKLTRIIEGWIKEVPSQWSWIHRRWKSRPSEKIKQMPFKIEGS